MKVSLLASLVFLLGCEQSPDPAKNSSAPKSEFQAGSLTAYDVCRGTVCISKVIDTQTNKQYLVFTYTRVGDGVAISVVEIKDQEK